MTFQVWIKRLFRKKVYCKNVICINDRRDCSAYCQACSDKWNNKDVEMKLEKVEAITEPLVPVIPSRRKRMVIVQGIIFTVVMILGFLVWVL